MKIDDARRCHIQAVQAWLEKNVRVYPTPSRISLRQIQLDFNTLRGEALLLVGDALPGEALTLQMGDDGWLTFTPPMDARERRHSSCHVVIPGFFERLGSVNVPLISGGRGVRKDAESCVWRGGEGRGKHLSATFRRAVTGVSMLPTCRN